MSFFLDPQYRHAEVQVAARALVFQPEAEEAAHGQAVRVVAAGHHESRRSAEQDDESAVHRAGNRPFAPGC